MPSAGFGATAGPQSIGFQPQNPMMQVLELLLSALFRTGGGWNSFLGGQPQQNPYNFPPQQANPYGAVTNFAQAGAYGGGGYAQAGAYGGGYGGGYSYGGGAPQQSVAVAYSPPPVQTPPPPPATGGGGGGGYGG